MEASESLNSNIHQQVSCRENVDARTRDDCVVDHLASSICQYLGIFNNWLLVKRFS